MSRLELRPAQELRLLRDLGFEDAFPPSPPRVAALANAGPRVEDLEEVAAEAQACRACRLSEQRNTVVFGDGAADADLLFVGEGPGFQEDRQGLPFVGPAGQLLTRMIEAIDLRREDVYITNVVKCRPPNNRDPQPDETAACRSFLERQIELIQPRLIVALGRVAAQQLLERKDALGRMRGRWHDVRGVPVRVTYHPAFLLRDPSYKRAAWEDMQIVRDRLLAESRAGQGDST